MNWLNRSFTLCFSHQRTWWHRPLAGVHRRDACATRENTFVVLQFSVTPCRQRPRRLHGEKSGPFGSLFPKPLERRVEFQTVARCLFNQIGKNRFRVGMIVVEQNNVSGNDWVSFKPGMQMMRRVTGVISGIVAPQNNRLSVTPCAPQFRNAQQALGRTEKRGPDSHHVTQQLFSPFDFFAQLVRRRPLRFGMRPGVMSQGMTVVNNPSHNLRMPLGLASDQKKRRAETGLFQQIENSRRVLRMRAVVKRQTGKSAACRSLHQKQPFRQCRLHRAAEQPARHCSDVR